MKKHMPTQPAAVTRDLKQRAYWRTIHRIRSKLAPYERLASRVLHQPLIDSTSGIVAQTIARPSGLLGGAIAALLASVVLLILTKRIGIDYNYFIVFIFFGGGFLVGLLLEAIYKIIHPRR